MTLDQQEELQSRLERLEFTAPLITLDEKSHHEKMPTELRERIRLLLERRMEKERAPKPKKEKKSRFAGKQGDEEEKDTKLDEWLLIWNERKSEEARETALRESKFLQKIRDDMFATTSVAALASASGDLNVLRDMLTKGEDLNLKTRAGNTNLHLALQRGEDDVVDFLLDEAKVPLNQRTKRGYTELMTAGRKGNMRAVEKLIEAGADLRAVNGQGKNTYHCLLEHGQTEAAGRVKVAMEARGIDPNFCRPVAAPPAAVVAAPKLEPAPPV